jgi:hypothetical protein
MLLQLKTNPRIDNLRHYPDETVEKLRGILARGARAYPDPHRRNFYDVENGSRMFYIHLTPAGHVWLLATWLKEAPQPAVLPAAELAVAHP